MLGDFIGIRTLALSRGGGAESDLITFGRGDQRCKRLILMPGDSQSPKVIERIDQTRMQYLILLRWRPPSQATGPCA